MWLSKESNPREVAPIFSLFFLYIQNKIYVFVTNAGLQDNYMKIIAIIFLLIFNELQTNYMEMKMNCKTIIFNELNYIKRRKTRCRNVGFNMLNPLSLFKFYLF